jgi:peptidoglycan/LPS O-acetylase OafA/YrhL
MKTVEKNFYRSDIDGLRAIAILTVVLYHANFSWMSGGFVGVDVFFVISGFLITRLLLAEAKGTGTIQFASFYARRMKRLMPAFFAVVLGTLILLLFIAPGMEDSIRFANSIKWSMVGFANLFFKRNTGGYFDGPSEEIPFLHFWSLSVEEQFYLVWPLLIWFAVKKRPAMMLGLLTLVSFAFSVFQMHENQVSSAFYLMPHRAWELGVGGLLAFNLSSSKRFSSGMGNWMSLVGMALIGYATLTFNHQTVFPGVSALFPVMGTALLILGGSTASNFVSVALSNSVFLKVGMLSYGWYLWHWPLLVILKLSQLGAEPSQTSKILVLLMALFLAELSLRFIETPVRVGPFLKKWKPGKILMLGLVLNLMIGAIGFRFQTIEDSVLSLSIDRSVIQSVRERSAFESQCNTKDTVGSVNCSVDYSGGHSNREVVIWGDSHSCSQFTLVDQLAQSRKISVTFYCQGQTPPLLNSDPQSFEAKVLADIEKKVHAGRKVSLVMAARWVAYSGAKTIAIDRGNFPVISDFKKRLSDALAHLKVMGVQKVLLIRPYPEFKYQPLRCLYSAHEPCEVSLFELKEYQKSTNRMIDELLAEHSFLKAIDPLVALCNSEKCPQLMGQMPVVSDTNHPTVAAVNRVYRHLEHEFSWLD